MSVADRLRGDRSIAARGHLSLDREKAREKLRMFRLPDPHFYVLQFVRAASVLGAGAIEFHVSTNEMMCKFDAVLPAELLEDIWGVAFEERTDQGAQAVHYVALGVGSAQALNPSYILIHSGDLTLRLDDDREQLSPREQKHSGVGTGTTIYVREKFRFGHVIEFFTSFGGKLAEEAVLEERCAYSAIEVKINRRTNRKLAHHEWRLHTPIKEPQEQGFVALDKVSIDGWCELYKDGVALSKVTIGNHGLAAVGAMESARVQTDLSGLALIQQDGWDAPIDEVFFPHYHRALRQSLRSWPVDAVGDQLDCLAEVAEYAGKRQGEIADSTRELLEVLFERPLFENALSPPGPPTLSINDATWPTIVRYSTKRFPGLETRDQRPILLVEPSTAGLDGVRERMLRESAMIALARSGQWMITNVTMQLDVQDEANRNEAMWRARPVHQIGGHRYQAEETIGPRRGVVFIPLASPDELIGYDAAGFFAYREAKLLRHRESDMGLAVEVDGDLGVTRRFDDVLRDPGFRRLAVQLCTKTLSLHQRFATDLMNSGLQERERPRVLDRFALSLCNGVWCESFFTMVGFMPVQADQMVEEHRTELAELLWFEERQEIPELLARLGSIANVESIALANGSWCSLADALQQADLSVLAPSGDWRAFVAKVRRQLGPDVLANIAIVDAVQEQLLRRLRAVPDARVAVERIYARQRFFERSPYKVHFPHDCSRVTKAEANFEATIALVPEGPANRCETTFVWNDRALGTRSFPVAVGSFEAIVRSDSFRPSENYDDVEYDALVEEVGQFVVAESKRLLDEWWTRQHAAGPPKPGPGFDLFVMLAHWLAPRHPAKRMLPVLIRVDDEWQSGLASRDELRSIAARSGLVLSYTTSDVVDELLLAHPDAHVIRLGATQDPEALEGVLGRKLRLIDATPVAQGVRVTPQSFWDKPTQRAGVDGAAFEWSGVIRGLDCHCGIYPEPHNSSAAVEERIDVTTASTVELQRLHGVGPALAAAIVLFRGHQELAKPEDLLRVPGIGPSTFEGLKNSITVGGKESSGRSSNLVSVLFQGRKLESLDVEIPMGKFRTTVAGDPVVPDPTYKFAAGGRDKVLLVAHEAPVKTIESVCAAASALGEPLADLAADLRRFLVVCYRTDVQPPFGQLVWTLSSTPLYPTCVGRWVSYDNLASVAIDGLLWWARDGDQPHVLKLTDSEARALATIAAPKFEVRQAMSPFVTASAPPPSTAPVAATRHVEGDPILDTLTDLLIDARGDRVDLFDDYLAQNVRWAPALERALCRVSEDGVDINPTHPVVKMVMDAGDIGSCAFLASTIYSSINAYYQTITDHDELELQSRLVRCLGE